MVKDRVTSHAKEKHLIRLFLVGLEKKQSGEVQGYFILGNG